MEKNKAAVALGRTGGEKRWADKTEKERKEHTRLMGIKSGEARRKAKKVAKNKDS
jgi:hypothetical protein